MEKNQPKVDRDGMTKRRVWPIALLAALVCVLVAGGIVFALGRLGTFGAQQPKQQEQQVPKEVVVNDQAAPEQESLAEAVPQEPVEVRLLMIGDILLHMGVIESGNRGDGTYNFDHLFVPILDDVAQADVAVLNQETILGGNG